MSGDAVISGVLSPIDSTFPGRIHRLSLVRLGPDRNWCSFEWDDSLGVAGAFGFASLDPGAYQIGIVGFRLESYVDTVVVEESEHRQVSLLFETSNLLRDCLSESECRRILNGLPPIRIIEGAEPSALQRLGLRLAATIGAWSTDRSNVLCVDSPTAEVRSDLGPLFVDISDRSECERRGEFVSVLYHTPSGRAGVLLSIERTYQRLDGTYIIEFIRSSGNRSGAGYECAVRAESGILVPDSCWMVWIT